MTLWTRRLVWVGSALLCLALVTPALAGDKPDMSPELHDQGRHAVDDGLHFLRGTQAEDGSWSNSVGVTAIALRAFLESYRGYSEKDGAFITRPVAFILAHVNPDGSIVETNRDRAYSTAVAVVALQATGNPAYKKTIENAQRFLAGLQVDEAEGYDKTHAYYGGIGYGGDERPDLSNAYMALEALAASGLPKDDPVFKRAQIFVSRCQNRSESNDQEWAANDGGFTYMPGYSPHGGTGSYGGMTHAGLISLLFAGVDRNDPRVQAAHDWIRAHYTLEENPSTQGTSGLYYYYEVFAKSMAAYGDSDITSTDGVHHNWRNDYVSQMLKLQNKDGSWVNPDSGRWWEHDKNLITSRIVIGLNLATREPSDKPGEEED